MTTVDAKLSANRKYAVCGACGRSLCRRDRVDEGDAIRRELTEAPPRFMGDEFPEWLRQQGDAIRRLFDEFPEWLRQQGDAIRPVDEAPPLTPAELRIVEMEMPSLFRVHYVLVWDGDWYTVGDHIERGSSAPDRLARGNAPIRRDFQRMFRDPLDEGHSPKQIVRDGDGSALCPWAVCGAMNRIIAERLHVQSGEGVMRRYDDSTWFARPAKTKPEDRRPAS